MGGGRGAGGRVEGVGIGGYSGARTSPPFLPNIIVIAGRVAAFPRTLGVTIIIEVEQDDREMRQLSHYSFDGGYHGGTVRWSPSPRYSWMVHLNISKVFSGRYMVMSLFERSRRLSRPTLPMIFKMKYRWTIENVYLSLRSFVRKCVVIVSIKSNHLPFYLAIRIFTSRKNFCWFTFKARRSIADRSKFMQVIWLFLDKMNNLSKTIQKYKKKNTFPYFSHFELTSQP